MTKEELEKVVQGAEYDFLRENPHLGSNIMFLTLGGSHAYGTNVPGSDVDVRGVTGDSKYDLLGLVHLNRLWNNLPTRRFTVSVNSYRSLLTATPTSSKCSAANRIIT